MLEETIGVTIVVKINNQLIDLPASWYVLMVDEDTNMIDSIQVSKLASSGCKVFLMHPELPRHLIVDLELVDMKQEKSVSHLTIPKHCLALHPVGTTENSKGLHMCFLLGPTDVGKNMNNLSALDLLS